MFGPERKEEITDMLYRYKDGVSLWYKGGTCSNVDVEIDVVDKTVLLVRAYHVT